MGNAQTSLFSSKRLAEILSGEADLEGTLYIGYPSSALSEGSFPIDALLVSPTKGLVLFNVVEGKNLPDYAEAKMRASIRCRQSCFSIRI